MVRGTCSTCRAWWSCSSDRSSGVCEARLSRRVSAAWAAAGPLTVAALAAAAADCTTRAGSSCALQGEGSPPRPDGSG